MVAYKREMHDFNFYDEYDCNNLEIIMYKQTYEETLKMVKKLNPILFLPASYDDLCMAMRLSDDLDLKTNTFHFVLLFIIKTYSK